MTRKKAKPKAKGKDTNLKQQTDGAEDGVVTVDPTIEVLERSETSFDWLWPTGLPKKKGSKPIEPSVVNFSVSYLKPRTETVGAVDIPLTRQPVAGIDKQLIGEKRTLSDVRNIAGDDKAAAGGTPGCFEQIVKPTKVAKITTTPSKAPKHMHL